METKKFEQAPHKDNTQEYQIFRKKPSSIEEKITDNFEKYLL